MNSSQHTPLEQRRWQCRDLIQVVCNLCGSSDSKILARENGLDIVLCRKCGLVYVNPRPGDEELARFYRQYYPPNVGTRWKKATSGLFNIDAGRLSTLSPGRRVLDVGCGFGFFLQLMQERGWDVQGCDLSDSAVTYARTQLGLSGIRQGHFHKLRFPTGCFDAISAWYVLHHLSDPRQALEKACASLDKNGIIALRVPNHTLFKSLWWLKRFDCEGLRILLRAIRKETADCGVPYNVLDPPVHLFAFTPQVLSRFLKETGFSIIRVFNDGMVSRGDIINRLVDGGITRSADIIKLLSRGRVDLSISFSIYARKV